jgi:hypothetical protein
MNQVMDVLLKRKSVRWSTNSRTGTDVCFGGGESTREKSLILQWADTLFVMRLPMNHFIEIRKGTYPPALPKWEGG